MADDTKDPREAVLEGWLDKVGSVRHRPHEPIELLARLDAADPLRAANERLLEALQRIRGEIVHLSVDDYSAETPESVLAAIRGIVLHALTSTGDDNAE